MIENSVATLCGVEKMGFEPTTSWLPVKRSSQLSYIPIVEGKYSQEFVSLAIVGEHLFWFWLSG